VSVFLLIAALPPRARASTYVPVGDDVYAILGRLEAEGVIKSGILTTRPISRKEAARLASEAEKNAAGRSRFIISLADALKEEFADEIEGENSLRPGDPVYGRYVYTDSDSRALNYNNDGDTYDEGWNLRAGFASRAETGWLSLYLNPELRASDEDADFVSKRVYGVLSLAGVDVVAGRESQWWGPGYHGALLLSNNAKPLLLAMITNPEPVILPGVLRNLGLFRFSFFVSRLEEERDDVSEPYLWGMRLNLKPSPYVEIGLHRTAMLGGKGKDDSLSVWLKSFVGGEESPSEPVDQLAGLDLKLTFPFEAQPVQIYAEAAGEDEAGGLPSRWAYIAGVYLPRVLSLENLSLRGEYANNHVSGYPNYWYRHHIYTDGYTYKNRIIGHHMGTDSEDIFAEISCLFPEKHAKISAYYDMEEHNLSRKVREKKDEFGLRAAIEAFRGLDIAVFYSYGKIENPGNVASNDEKINMISAIARYSF
jgi:hypothetical protein